MQTTITLCPYCRSLQTAITNIDNGFIVTTCLNCHRVISAKVVLPTELKIFEEPEENFEKNKKVSEN